jgi:hypothetical protein
MQLDRTLIQKSGIEWLEAEEFFPLSADERKAWSNLELLNQDIELQTKPQQGENHNVFIYIYKKWVDTEANRKAIQLREDAILAEALSWLQAPQQAPDEAGTNVGRQMGASMLANQQATQTNSLADITM